MEPPGQLGQVDEGAAEGKAVAIRLLVDDLGLPAGHLSPVFLGDVAVILPAKLLFLLLLVTLEGRPLVPGEVLAVDHLLVSAGDEVAVDPRRGAAGHGGHGRAWGVGRTSE